MVLPVAKTEPELNLNLIVKLFDSGEYEIDEHVAVATGLSKDIEHAEVGIEYELERNVCDDELLK